MLNDINAFKSSEIDYCTTWLSMENNVLSFNTLYSRFPIVINMVVVNVSGIPVDFPFEPYEVQTRYMEKVLECLRFSCNGVLESPTGTGKTLSLLCACLAYLEDYKANVKKQMVAGGMANESETSQSMASLTSGPKLVYAMRTHSQVSHAFSELLRTGYKNVKATVIGSRDQLCLNPDVTNESNKSIKINLCKSKVNSSSCHFYNNVEATLAVTSNRKLTVDIEDLMQIGKKNQCCPYYLSRSLTREADVVFMPYNYLLDAKSRKFLDVNIEGNIVIFDEAHNVEQLCEVSASSELRSRDIAVAISEVTFIMQKLATLSVATSNGEQGAGEGFDDLDRNIDFGLDEVCCIKSLLCELETQLDNVELGSEGGVALNGNAIFGLLEKSGVTTENKTYIIRMMEKLINYLSVGVNNIGMRKGGSLQKCVEMIAVVFQTDKSNQLMLLKHSSSYKVYVSKDESKKPTDVWSLAKQTKQPKVLHLWCFNPGVSMKQLLAENPRCVIFTSGTLAPLDSFISEMQIQIPVRLENPHIIQRTQLHACVVSKGPDGVTLNSSYRTRSDLNYVLSLGKTIINFTRVVPRGVLVFFPSYYMMKECHKQWEEHGVWNTLSSLKKIFVETQGQDISRLIEDYYEKNREAGGSGAIMMAVCRGKVSEGIDFADDNGRCVIVTGLPFRPWKDPKVVGKMEYVSSQFSKKAVSMSGRDWYDLEGTRAVNQAVGRVIRHKDDYATVLLCDVRFGNHKVQSQLSAWLKPYLNVYDTFGFALRDIVRFFRPKRDLNNVNIGFVSVSHSIAVPPTSSLPALQDKSDYSSGSGSDSIAEELKWAKNLSDYSVSTVRSPSSTSTSLFEALESDSKSFSDIKQTNSPNASTTVALVRPGSPPSYEVKRKKIKVIGPQQTYEMAAHTSSHNDSSEQKNLPTTEILLKNLKSLLTVDQYRVFSSAIKVYNGNKDVNQLAHTVSTICKNRSIQKGLLAFCCILPESDRVKFKSVLLQCQT